MLTASQCRTVAFTADGGFLHVACARAEYGAVAIERREYGMSVGLTDVSPVSSYELGEYITETASEDAYERGEEPSYDYDVERYAPTCERCSEVILP